MELSVVIGGGYRLSFQNLLSRLPYTKISFFFHSCVRYFCFDDIGNIYTVQILHTHTRKIRKRLRAWGSFDVRE